MSRGDEKAKEICRENLELKSSKRENSSIEAKAVQQMPTVSGVCELLSFFESPHTETFENDMKDIDKCLKNILNPMYGEAEDESSNGESKRLELVSLVKYLYERYQPLYEHYDRAAKVVANSIEENHRSITESIAILQAENTSQNQETVSLEEQLQADADQRLKKVDEENNSQNPEGSRSSRRRKKGKKPIKDCRNEAHPKMVDLVRKVTSMAKEDEVLTMEDFMKETNNAMEDIQNEADVEFRDKYAKLLSFHASMFSENGDLKNELASAQDLQDSLLRKNFFVEQAYHTLRSEHSQALHDLGMLKEHNTRLSGENKGFRRIVENDDDEKDALWLEHKMATDKIEKTHEIVEKLKAEVENLNRDNAQLRAKNLDLMLKLESAIQEASDLICPLKEAREEISTAPSKKAVVLGNVKGSGSGKELFREEKCPQMENKMVSRNRNLGLVIKMVVKSKEEMKHLLLTVNEDQTKEICKLVERQKEVSLNLEISESIKAKMEKEIAMLEDKLEASETELKELEKYRGTTEELREQSKRNGEQILALARKTANLEKKLIEIKDSKDGGIEALRCGLLALEQIIEDGCVDLHGRLLDYEEEIEMMKFEKCEKIAAELDTNE